MTPTTMGSGATEQARLELGVAAIASERRNRPRWLLWGAGLAVLAALIYAFTGLSARGDAANRLDQARARRTAVAKVIDEISALRAAEGARGLAPNPFVPSHLEKLAASLGLKLQGNIKETDDTAITVPGMTRKKYIAHIANENPDTIFKWLNATRTTGELAGIELVQFKITPGAGQGYTCEVLFNRWEKRS